MRILNALLGITIYSAVIFCLTMLAKKLLKDRLSPLLHYAIWSVLVLRLMMPVTINSPVQFFTIPSEQGAVVEPMSRQTAAADSAADGAATVLQTRPEPDPASPAAPSAPTQIGAFTAPPKPAVSICAMLLAIWLLGVGIGVGYLVLLYIRLRLHIVRNAAKPSKRLKALFWEIKREMGITAKVPLVCLFGNASPGLLFPACVLMPMQTLAVMDDGQIKNMLAHELMHYRRKDQIACILLSVLNAVYWFNPIVWIAVRQIRADMEMACDSAVVRRMNADEKGGYAALILELFSRTRYRQVVLGMAHGTSKSMAEQRIRGVFMNRKSKSGAKALCACLALVMAVGCFTTACVPKAAEKQARSVADGADGPAQAAMSDAGSASGSRHDTGVAPMSAQQRADGPLFEKLGVPTRWSFEQRSADGLLLVRGDLDVTLPDVAAIPVATAVFRELTEADLINVAGAVFGNDIKYTYAVQDTKEWMENWAASTKKILDTIEDGTCENKLASFEKSVRGQYQYYSEKVKTAPSAAEEKLPVFSEMSSITGDTYMGFRGVVSRDGTDYVVSASARSVHIAESYKDRILSYLGTYRTVPEGVRLTREQAIERAGALAAQIDDGLSLCHVMTVGLGDNNGEDRWAHPWAWQCVFMRQINGCGAVYDSRDVGSDITSNVQGRTSETLNITVDDRGVCNVQWVNPMTISQIIDPDAALLPFDEIAKKLADQLREKFDYDVTKENGYHEIYIQRAELGLMRIGKPDSKTYRFEPVWSFFTTFEAQPDYSDPGLQKAAYMGDPAYWNSLTVSALDGRLINRDYGA